MALESEFFEASYDPLKKSIAVYSTQAVKLRPLECSCQCPIECKISFLTSDHCRTCNLWSCYQCMLAKHSNTMNHHIQIWDAKCGLIDKELNDPTDTFASCSETNCFSQIQSRTVTLIDLQGNFITY